MRPIGKVYPNSREDGYFSVSHYQPLLESLGHEILVQIDDENYEGDSRLLLENGERYGILVFGWGSCSGCDALDACSSLAEVRELRKDIYERIVWGNAEETLSYLRNHDWRGDFSWNRETRDFIEKAIEKITSRKQLPDYVFVADGLGLR